MEYKNQVFDIIQNIFYDVGVEKSKLTLQIKERWFYYERIREWHYF